MSIFLGFLTRKPLWMIHFFGFAILLSAIAQDTQEESNLITLPQARDPWAVIETLAGRAEHKPENWEELVKLNKEIEAYAKTGTSPKLSQALSSHRAFWSFLTSPYTSYLDRMAAVEQGANVFDLNDLPRFFDVRENLGKLWNIVGPDPNNFPDAPTYEPPPTMTLFGIEWTPPQSQIPWPITLEDYEATPWQWQAYQAFSRLWRKLLTTQFHPQNRLRWLQAAQSMPCRTQREQLHFIKATGWLHTFQPKGEEWPLVLEILGKWRNMGLQPIQKSGISIPALLISIHLSWQQTEGEWLGQAIMLELLETNNDQLTYKEVVRSIRVIIANMGGPKLGTKPMPATLTLIAINDLLQSNQRLYVRYVDAFSILDAMGESPERIEGTIARDSPLLEAQLSEMLETLKMKRIELEVLAQEEAVHIEGAQEQVPYISKCLSLKRD